MTKSAIFCSNFKITQKNYDEGTDFQSNYQLVIFIKYHICEF